MFGSCKSMSLVDSSRDLPLPVIFLTRLHPVTFTRLGGAGAHLRLVRLLARARLHQLHQRLQPRANRARISLLVLSMRASLLLHVGQSMR